VFVVSKGIIGKKNADDGASMGFAMEGTAEKQPTSEGMRT
jgi:hypothetical protein